MGCPHLEVNEGRNKHIVSEASNFQNNLENQNIPAPAYQNIPTLDKLKEDLIKFVERIDIIDTLTEKDDTQSPPLISLKKQEIDIMKEFLNSKANEIKNDIDSFRDKDILKINNKEELNRLTETLLSKLYIKRVYIQKIKDEISNIEEREDLFKIDYLTIMIVGKSGVGKSTLINKFLELRRSNEAQVGIGRFQTTEIKPYTSSKVPYLRLVDTRGIELSQKFGANEVLNVSKKFINEQIKKNNSKDFVQCIWYCITGPRLEDVETDLLEKLRKTYPDSKIPIIIVYTQAVDELITKKMAEYIKELKLDAKFIPILAGEKRLMNKITMEPFGKEDLIMETLKKCEEALQVGDMCSLMTKQISNHLIQFFERQFEKTEEIEKLLIYKFLNDFNKVLTKEEITQFIINILVNIFDNFLQNNNNNERNIKRILENQFKEHLKKYIDYCKNKIERKINSTLDEKCYQFINIQVEEEIDKNEHIPIKKKRVFKQFKETTKNFLETNLIYIYEKGYIKMLLDEIKILIDNIKESLNKKLKEEYIFEREITDSINECFQGKFLKLKNEIEITLKINENNFNNNNPPYYNYVDYPENQESDNNYQLLNREEQENINNRRTIEESNGNDNDNDNENYNSNFNNNNQDDMIQNNINNESNDNNEDNNSPYPGL